MQALTCVEVGLFDGVLSSSKPLEKTFVSGHACESGAMFCELPAGGLEFEVSLNVWPIEGGLPFLNPQVFVSPSLIVGVVVGKVDSTVVVEVVLGMPVA